ncbi:MAG: Rrf2 family transcriptional regulator [Methanothrix sp.]|nr:Rrf2 family transcriptional regulator [Methanothrix sp.]
MKLSTRTQYGLRMLCQLAAEFSNGPVQMNEIGRREGISEKYLGQIMLILRSSGLVSSVRGAQGGYYLSRPPDRIGLLEVFEILEGEVLEFGDAAAEAEAVAADDASERRDTAGSTNIIWTRLRTAVEDSLRAYSLDDAVKLGMYRAGYVDYRI